MTPSTGRKPRLSASRHTNAFTLPQALLAVAATLQLLVTARGACAQDSGSGPMSRFPRTSPRASHIAQEAPLSPGLPATVPAVTARRRLPRPSFPYAPPSEALDDEWDPLSAPALTLVLYYALTTDSPMQSKVNGRIVLDTTLEAAESAGARLYLDYHLGPYLSLGVAAGLASWTTVDELLADYDPSTLISASATVTLWLPSNEYVRQYLRGIGGLSVDQPPAGWVIGGHFQRAAGWHAGGVYGVYLGGRHAGVILEMGAILHRLRAKIGDGLGSRGSMTRSLLELPFALGVQLNL